MGRIMFFWVIVPDILMIQDNKIFFWVMGVEKIIQMGSLMHLLVSDQVTKTH